MASKQQPPGPAPALIPTILVSLLLALVVLLAPATGTWQMDTRGSTPAAPEPEIGQEGPEEEIFENTPDDQTFSTPIAYESFQFPPIWGQIVVGVVVLLAVATGVMLAWLFIRYRRTLPADADRDDLHIDTEVNPEAQIPVMSRAAARAQDQLRAATAPTDAIIKAWLILEDAAASSGMRRKPSDTPTDLTMIVLERTQADPAATRGLLSLYHQARFGTSPMSAADQEQAARHLQALSRSWEQVRL